MARAEDRYVNLTTKTLSNGQLVYKSVRPIKVETDPLTDISILATDTARMDVLANNVYGGAAEWWRIASANGKVNGSLYMKPGEKIIIPRG